MPLPISKDYLLIQLRNFKSVILDPAYIIQKSTLPSATEDNEGVIYQYTGTASGMTLGGFYQCQEVTPTTSPKTYTWVEITTKTSIDDVTIKENLNSEIYVPNATSSALGVIKLGDGFETDANGATNVIDRIKVVSTMPTAVSTLVGNVAIYLGTTTADYRKGCIYQCISDEDPTSPTYSWVVLSGDSTQIASLPTASASNLGKVYQYVGTDDSTNGLIHAHFYECVSDGESTPTYSWHDLGYKKVFQGTLDEWNALTSAEQTNYDFIASPDEADITGSYSTTETKTGATWIDGKPIYRKCGIYNNGASTGTGTVILDSTLTSSYIDTVISTGGCGTTSSQSKLPIGGYSGDPYRTVIHPGTNGLTKASSTDAYTDFKWWIEYTKTTD